MKKVAGTKFLFSWQAIINFAFYHDEIKSWPETEREQKIKALTEFSINEKFPFGIFQLNSPNRILLLHLSVVCLALSFLYLWALINNSIIPSYSNRAIDSSILPPSLAITTVTTTTASSETGDSLLSSTVSHPLDFTKSRIYESFSNFNDLLIHLFQPIGLWTISCINFDRYYAICSPLHYNNLLTTKKVSEFNFCSLTEI